MLPERLKSIVLTGVLSTDPGVAATASQAQQREATIHQAHLLGIAPETINRMERVADHVGPRTRLPNIAVWDAVWQSMLDRAARGEAPIPSDDPPIAWARGIWQIIFHADPDTYAAPVVFAGLVKALMHARDDAF